MTYRAEVETIVLALDYIFVAHADRNPIRVGFLDPESHFLDRLAILQRWLHDCKFIARTIAALDNHIADYLDIGMLELRSKLEDGILPKVYPFLLIL